MSEPIYATNTCPRWLGAPVPQPTLGDKIRGCEELITQLREKRKEAVQEIAFLQAQFEAIDDHLTQAESRLTHLEELEQDERYGTP